MSGGTTTTLTFTYDNLTEIYGVNAVTQSTYLGKYLLTIEGNTVKLEIYQMVGGWYESDITVTVVGK